MKLNEAFQSTIIQKMWQNPMGKKAIMLLRGAYPLLDINRIQDSNIQFMDPAKSLKMNADGLKFWMNGNKLVGITRSNSGFDNWFEVNKKRRRDIVCMEQDFLDVYKSGPSNVKAATTGCYVLDVKDALLNGASTKDISNERKLARTGALALMTNRQIKQMNIDRYKLLLKDKAFSDGSEFNLIQNANKLLIDFIKKSTATELFIDIIISGSFTLNYLQAYSNSLVEYIELLDKNGYLLPNNVDFDEYGYRNNNDEQKLAKLRNDLKKGIDDIKRNLVPRNHYTRAVKAIMNNTKDLNDFKTLVSAAKGFNEDAWWTIMNFVNMLERSFPSAVSNPNISSSILNFDLFIMQLAGIEDQLRNNDQIRKITDFLGSLDYYCEKHPTNVNSDDIYIRWAAINSSIFRRVSSYISLIAKI